MESNYPENITPGTTPEVQPAQPIAPEQYGSIPASPEAPIASPETPVEAENLSIDHVGKTMIDPMSPAQPLPGPVPAQQSIPVAVTTTPPKADDNDVIEKEWIAKVKQVISSTSGDPHAQQSEVSRLMADYVLKRFGKKIGRVGD